MHDTDRVFSWTLAPALAAAALPTLLAFNLPPSPTFLNQALAFLCWGFFAAAVAHAIGLNDPERGAAAKALRGPASVSILLALAALGSWLWGSLPTSLLLSALATLGAVVVLAAAGARAGASTQQSARAVFAAFCVAWVCAGLLNAAVGLIQVFAPQWADGDWIARSSLAGRAVGNLRQPNHVCTLLLWATIAWITLIESRRLNRYLIVVVLAMLAWGLVLTASRTAIVGIALLALWGWLDRGLSRRARLALTGTAVLFVLAWVGTALWASVSQEAFGARDRLAEADLSASRFRIWADAIRLVLAHPLLGVGFGNFNFAWSLAVLPQRPPAFFDHAHNLSLHWAVELGLPLAILLSLLLLAMLWRIARSAGAASHPSATASLLPRASLAFLLLMALHSQLEYPLWYAYFLLPTAWLLGFALALAQRIDSAVQTGRAGAAGIVEEKPQPSAGVAGTVLLAASLILAIGSALSVSDYARVAAIFDGRAAEPLSTRIARGQRSVFFAHHADYAAATTSDRPEQELEAFGRAAHYLLDTRLMTGWADAHAAAGDLERARHLAARLREFRNPNSADYFAPCATTASAAASAATQPYQCQPAAPGRLNWTDFR